MNAWSNISVASTDVPNWPSVATFTRSNALTATTMAVRPDSSTAPLMVGTVMRPKIWVSDAPSTRAASRTSPGTREMAAERMSIATAV